MTLRSKMVATISAFCLVLAMLIIGVWAAQSVKVEMGGSLTFKADDVNVRIEGLVEGAEVNPTLSTLVYSGNDSEVTGDASTWQNNALTFGRTDESVNDIVITITITNLSKENAVNIKVKDTIGSSVNVTKTVERDGAEYNLGEPYALSKSTTDSESTATFTITFSVTDKTQSVSGVKYGYIIDLSDESYVAPDPVVSSDLSLGTVKFEDNKDGTTTLTATPKENAVFVGWKNDTTGQLFDVNVWEASYDKEVLSQIGITNDSEIFNSNFVDYSFYKTNISYETKLNEFKDILEGAKDSLTTEQYNSYLAVIKNIENNTFYYTIDSNDDSTYTAVFSNNNFIPVEENGYTFDYYEDANVAFISSCTIMSGEITLPSTIESKTESQVVGFKPILDTFDAGFGGQKIFDPSNQITSIVVPNSFCEIARGAFYDMLSLQNVEIQCNLTSINEGTFNGCKSLSTIEIPETVTSIGDSAFSGSGISSIIIPDSVTRIGNAFGGCKNLKSITIPKNVKIIDYYTFWGAGLENIVILGNVESIGEHALLCDNLKSITIYSTEPPELYGSGSDNGGIPSTIQTIKVPQGYLEVYEQAAGWSSFAGKFVEM